MSIAYPRPVERFIAEPFEAVDTPCPGCRGRSVRRYRLLRAGGWHRVERCRDCFLFLSSEPIAQSFVPLTAGWPTSRAG